MTPNGSTPKADFDRWKEILQKPDWYLTLVPEIQALTKKAGSLPKKEKDEAKKGLYDFFEDSLRTNRINLGNEVGIWDTERKPIDKIIIHHTSNPAGMSSTRLSAMELILLYAPYYANPTEEFAKGKPISSGHVRNGKQVFYPYHWFIRTNGSKERLLLDEEIGWQAGDWDVNCRSVAICFDNDYTNSRPSDTELQAAAQLISENYKSVNRSEIYGHDEIYKTECPSNLFLDKDGQKGWKHDLLDLLK